MKKKPALMTLAGTSLFFGFEGSFLLFAANGPLSPWH
jgi:hypothetical protein